MFTEVKEMIDSTIYENGKGEVTAQNVNLAMHGIVDAAEEAISTLDGKLNTETSNREALEERVTAIEENGVGGGSQPIVVYCGLLEETEEGKVHSLTTEEKAHNAEAFKAIKESRCLIPVFIDCTRMYNVSFGESAEVYSLYACSPAADVMYAHIREGGEMEGVEIEQIIILTYAKGNFRLLPDGTLTNY